MMRQKGLVLICVVMSIAICTISLWGSFNRKSNTEEALSSDVERIDIDSIQLVKSGVQVDFSEVIV